MLIISQVLCLHVCLGSMMFFQGKRNKNRRVHGKILTVSAVDGLGEVWLFYIIAGYPGLSLYL